MAKPPSELPPLFEGVLQLFEGLGKARVSFIFVETTQDRPCMYCGDPTALRLQCKAGEEVSVNTICSTCRDLIINAPVA